MTFKETEQCKGCIFYGLCRSADLEHCNNECYFKDVYNEESNN